MKKIKEYKVVQQVIAYGAEAHFELFAEKINSAIKEGWQPLGGVQVLQRGKSDSYLVMVCVYTPCRSAVTSK
jgi:hypothetical protein